MRFTPAHLPAFERMIDDHDIARYTPMPSPVPAGFGAAWLGRYDAARREGTREAFAIVDGADFLGVAVAPMINTTAREIELGYMVATQARGRGAATTALRDLTRWAFEELDMARAYLRINVGNEASVKVAQRAGYTLEGVLRSTWFKDDLRVDTEIWSRLPTDAPGVDPESR